MVTSGNKRYCPALTSEERAYLLGLWVLQMSGRNSPDCVELYRAARARPRGKLVHVFPDGITCGKLIDPNLRHLC